MVYAIISDVKAAGAQGGSFNSGAWQTRDLQTIDSDINGLIGSLSANQFTLGPGTYRVEISAPAYQAGNHSCRLYNVSGAVALFYSQIFYSDSSVGQNDFCQAKGIFTLSATSILRVEHYGTATRGTDGFGVGASIGENRFTQVLIEVVGR